jgi:hypothetical protein
MTADYTGFAYGQNQAINQQRQAAPMAGQPSATQAVPSPVQAVGPDVIPLDAPTQRPEEPVTYGAALGPGPGEDVLGLPPVSPYMESDSGIAAVRAMYLQDPNNQDLKRILAYVDRQGANQ